MTDPQAQPPTSHTPIGGFTGWEVPAGCSTFEVVQPFADPDIAADADLAHGPREHRFGSGHTAHLPGGGRFTVTPGDHDTRQRYWLWGLRFSNRPAARPRVDPN